MLNGKPRKDTGLENILFCKATGTLLYPVAGIIPTITTKDSLLEKSSGKLDYFIAYLRERTMRTMILQIWNIFALLHYLIVIETAHNLIPTFYLLS